VLAGGTGGALLAEGFARALRPPDELTVVANTADDVEMYGVVVSPDFDAVVYRLAGLFDEERRFGIAGDTFGAMAMFERLGAETWFRLGDRDLAFCLERTRLLRSGLTPSEAARELDRQLDLAALVLPMSDEPLRTWVRTERGELGIQEWFVRDGQRPPALEIQLRGVESARPAPGLAEILAAADLVVIGPSNPVISVEPILALLRPLLDRRRTLAVSPIVGGQALKGPTIEMLRSLGRAPTATAVAAGYRDVAGTFVLDVRDAGEADQIEKLGYFVTVTDTVMSSSAQRLSLARAIIKFAG